MAWNISLVSRGQLSWLCPLPPSCAPPAHSLVGWCEKQKRLWLRASTTAQQSLKHPHIINTVFSTNLKHSPILATMKKINSLPAKTSTSLEQDSALQRCSRWIKGWRLVVSHIHRGNIMKSSRLFTKHIKYTFTQKSYLAPSAECDISICKRTGWTVPFYVQLR